MKIKILFLIHDLGHGGAEKVLVNLVNHLDRSKFDITVISLFGGGVNEHFLLPHIHYRAIFHKSIPGNRIWMKLFSPGLLHFFFVRGRYDIEVSFLEGMSARVISGCPYPKTRLISWIHVEQKTEACFAMSFRSPEEAKALYRRFHRIVCVSAAVKDDFCRLSGITEPVSILYNVVESDKIRTLGNEPQEKIALDGAVRVAMVGTLKESKGYTRLLRIADRLHKEGYGVHFYILGVGPLQDSMMRFIALRRLESCVTLLGYDTNPYKYVACCDLFVCASYSEGFSTAATEALILGVPVCTTEVAGMREMLGENGEYGVITENDEEALYQGLKSLLDDPALLHCYRKKAKERGRRFNTKTTVRAIEAMLLDL